MVEIDIYVSIVIIIVHTPNFVRKLYVFVLFADTYASLQENMETQFALVRFFVVSVNVYYQADI